MNRDDGMNLIPLGFFAWLLCEPLQGTAVGGFPNGLQLIAPWPWAVASLFGQIVIGFAFIGIMWWYARWEKKRGVKA